MKTVSIFVDVFNGRTKGRKATFKVNNLTLDAVKIVLNGTMVKLETEHALEDVENGYLRRCNCTGCYGGNDGYIPTLKGYKEIFKALIFPQPC